MAGQMTVSVKKGTTGQTSIYHNNRSEYEKKFDYDKKGHTHIRSQDTHLNEIVIKKDIVSVYEDAFTDEIKRYNLGKKPGRQIGGGKALTRGEKELELMTLDLTHDYMQAPKKKREALLATFERDKKNLGADIGEIIKSNAQNFKSLSALRKEKTRVKKLETYGEALYKKQKNAKQQRTHQEIIVQVGNAQDYNVTNADGQLVDKDGKILPEVESSTRKLVRKDPEKWKQAKKILEKYIKEDFVKNNPNCVVFNAAIHMDEASPHAHIDFVPVAQMHGKNGLQVKPSFNMMLDNQGFKKDPRDNRKQFTQWQHRESESLEKLMQVTMGVTRKKGEKNRYKSTQEYKQAKANEARQQEKLRQQQVKIQQNEFYLSQQREKLDIISDFDKKVKERKEKIASQDKVLQDQQKTIDQNSSTLKSIELADSVIKKQDDKIKKNQKKLDTIDNFEKISKEKQAKIYTQNKTIRDNQPKLDLIKNYDSQVQVRKNSLDAIQAQESLSKKRKENYDKSIVEQKRALSERENYVSQREKKFSLRESNFEKVLDKIATYYYSYTSARVSDKKVSDFELENAIGQSQGKGRKFLSEIPEAIVKHPKDLIYAVCDYVDDVKSLPRDKFESFKEGVAVELTPEQKLKELKTRSVKDITGHNPKKRKIMRVSLPRLARKGIHKSEKEIDGPEI
ncbi:plasmid recombination protein [Lactobacillus sp. LL6]|uniref:plasmid recombination protein n=1 Tax=Lactobacillus sp. LL6 TaxID=2596827 RepID=UPI001186646D|nr:plasmid recombination protein [Lactobacillus sp. LL6]TSO25258.1 hypothetical protein FOD82_09745 [Lactobacillus sp. LL6]